ncbi:hypothetical protein D3C80_1412620 [compost metagenome]
MGEELDAADAHRHGVVHEQRVFRSDDQVARPDQHQAAGDALALHLGDGRLGDVAPALGKADVDFLFTRHLRLDGGGGATKAAKGPDSLPLRHGLCGVHLGNIVACGEMLAVGRQDDHLDVIVAVGAVHGSVELIQQVSVLGVAFVGTVQAYAGNVWCRFFVGNSLEVGRSRLSHDYSRIEEERSQVLCS